MSLLFISLATSSLIKETLPANSKQQPWAVRIAAQLVSPECQVIEGFATSIRAEGRKIEPGATRIHGITSSQADRGGIHEIFALGAIAGLKANGKRATDYPGLAASARYVICWQADFVRDVIGSLFLRHGEPSGAWIRPGLTFVSLQQIATPWCRLTGQDGSYRLPKRDEAAAQLLGLPERKTPVSPESNLDLEKLIYFWLEERGAFEKEAA